MISYPLAFLAMTSWVLVSVIILLNLRVCDAATELDYYFLSGAEIAGLGHELTLVLIAFNNRNKHMAHLLK
jgi:hypothetical protein